jgi:hypothetical protein
MAGAWLRCQVTPNRKAGAGVVSWSASQLGIRTFLRPQWPCFAMWNAGLSGSGCAEGRVPIPTRRRDRGGELMDAPGERAGHRWTDTVACTMRSWLSCLHIDTCGRGRSCWRSWSQVGRACWIADAADSDSSARHIEHGGACESIPVALAFPHARRRHAYPGQCVAARIRRPMKTTRNMCKPTSRSCAQIGVCKSRAGSDTQTWISSPRLNCSGAGFGKPARLPAYSA